jgi:hypothetical protein
MLTHSLGALGLDRFEVIFYNVDIKQKNAYFASFYEWIDPNIVHNFFKCNRCVGYMSM